ncbi:MAG TPA: HAD-IA family hydrolase [Gammaproteobacteria bacterium]|nr:HAD-IA family hydrolase [Gammaproteobacteria bacterium]
MTKQAPSIPTATDALRDARLVIFDWDGTLVDSRGVIVATMQAALAEAGLEVLPGEECQQVIGLGLDEALRTLVPEAGPEGWARLRDIYGRRFQEFGAGDMPFFPGVAEGLAQLGGQGRRLAVATGKSRRGLDRLLAEWDLHDTFHATRCADETASKPDPLMLREILAETGVAVERTVFVGDTGFDMEMAHHLGMPRIAVTYGVHGRERLAPWEPTAWAEDFTAVLRWLGCASLDPSPAEGYN